MHNRYTTTLFPFAFLLLLLQSTVTTGQEFKTIGYLPYYRFSLLNQIQLDKVTHLNIAFAEPDAAGYLGVFGTNITPVVQAGHNAGAEVFISLAANSASWSNWMFWLKPENRSEFIHNMVFFLQDYDLQGVDVDLEWSYVNSDYSGFILELRDSLDQYDYQLTAALPGTYRYPQVSSAALAAFDWVNMMVYDLTGPWAPNSPGPHSPYSFAVSSIAYWKAQGVVKERLTLGVPFYGYDFTNPNNVVSRTYSTMVGMDPANADLDQVGQIYYNGRPTITNKTMLAMEETSGIMIWELGQDRFDQYSLLNTIYATIYVPTSTSASADVVDVSVFPNPFVDEVHVRSNDTREGIVSISDLNGRLLAQTALNGNETTSLNVADLPSGMYVIQTVYDGYPVAKKLVKG